MELLFTLARGIHQNQRVVAALGWIERGCIYTIWRCTPIVSSHAPPPPDPFSPNVFLRIASHFCG